MADAKASTTKVTVTGLDFFRWVDADGVIREAERGKTVEVQSDVAERALKRGWVSKPGSKSAKAAKAGEEPVEETELTTPAGEPAEQQE